MFSSMTSPRITAFIVNLKQKFPSLKELRDKLEFLLSRNIIEPCTSPFEFPNLSSRRKNDPRPVADRTIYRLCTADHGRDVGTCH
mmetsp:Transcript_13227/g.46308  ORF Transcript_13227/g.46308 Transcript_13227/m.46308 type:complete len:85 (-) Transcript_13227:134-388(-)